MKAAVLKTFESSPTNISGQSKLIHRRVWILSFRQFFLCKEELETLLAHKSWRSHSNHQGAQKGHSWMKCFDLDVFWVEHMFLSFQHIQCKRKEEKVGRREELPLWPFHYETKHLFFLRFEGFFFFWLEIYFALVTHVKKSCRNQTKWFRSAVNEVWLLVVAFTFHTSANRLGLFSSFWQTGDTLSCI